MEIQLEQIQEMIYVIRGQRVMLDSDLAKLYGVETRVLFYKRGRYYNLLKIYGFGDEKFAKS